MPGISSSTSLTTSPSEKDIPKDTTTYNPHMHLCYKDLCIYIYIYTLASLTVSRWWFQPIWKILVKMGSSSPNRDEHKQYLKLTLIYFWVFVASLWKFSKRFFGTNSKRSKLEFTVIVFQIIKDFAVFSQQAALELGLFFLNLDAQTKLRSYVVPTKRTKLTSDSFRNLKR